MRITLNIPLSLYEILNAIKVDTGDFADIEIHALTTNSEQCSKGDLFVALKGNKFDGNDFVNSVINIGAYAISEKKIQGAFTVNDCELALLKIAELYKSKLLNLKKIIAITGSVGKSTTKELTHAILKAKYKTHSTHLNENNAIGVSYTILSADKSTEIIVLEIGMNHKGEIRKISDVIRPDIAIITNVGTAHIGNLGSREAIASAKLEILSGMKFSGKLLVDYDEPLLSGYGAISVSADDEGADAFMHIIELTSEKSVCDFYFKNTVLYNISFLPLGNHILKNLAFALSVAIMLKMTEIDIKSAISHISKEIFRQKIIKVSDFYVIDDTYNASLEALHSMLDYLFLFKGVKKSLVFSKILELGDYTEEIHESIGKLISQYPLNALYLIGDMSSTVTKSAINHGFEANKIFSFTSLSECADMLIQKSSRGEIVLVKGSHSTNLNELIEILKSKGQNYA